MRIHPASSFLKFLDQQPLVDRLHRAVPVLLPLSGAASVAYDTANAPKGERGKRFVKGASVVGFTIAGALLARRFMPGRVHDFKNAAARVLHALRQENPGVSSRLVRRLERFRAGKTLWPWQIHRLRRELSVASKRGEAHFQTLIPSPDKNKAADVTVREVWRDIKGLSLLGLLPVLGGIVGGVAGNLLNREKNWRRDLKNQAKEGLFQYLANIALCNVGAMGAILALKRTPLIHSKPARLIAMTGGIALVGILFGGAIANFFGRNFFNPLFERGPSGVIGHLRGKTAREGWRGLFRDVNAERHAEPADWGLHIDDFATMGVLSGMRWIEPLLPFLYSVSGYRAGVGYRNGKAEALPDEHAPLAEKRLSASGRENPFRQAGFAMHQAAAAPLRKGYAFIQQA